MSEDCQLTDLEAVWKDISEEVETTFLDSDVYRVRLPNGNYLWITDEECVVTNVPKAVRLDPKILNALSLSMDWLTERGAS